jgi:quercetin dioxygenase-like cupin family protein
VVAPSLTDHPLAPFIRGTSRGPWLDYMGHLVTILARYEDTGTISVLEAIVRKGFEPPRHVHESDDECYYVLEGRFHFEVGGTEYDAVPGDLIFLPRRVPHGWTAEQDGGRLLWLAVPGGIDELFTELGQPAEAYKLAEEPPSDPPIDRMVELLSSKFDISVAPR